MKNPKLFWYIFLPTLFLILAFTLLLVWHEGRIVSTIYNQQVQEKLVGWSRLLVPQIKLLSAGNPTDLQSFCRRTGRITATVITIMDGSGTVLADSNRSPLFMNNHHNQHEYPEVISAGQGEVGKIRRFDKTLKQDMVFVAIPFDLDKQGGGILRLGVPASKWSSVFSFFSIKVFFVGSGFVFTVAFFSWALARKISFPLVEMAKGARRFAEGKTDKLFAAVDYHGPREITVFAHALNKLARKVNKRVSFVIQQRNELELVFSSMKDGVLAIGTDHRVIRINRAVTELFNLEGMKVRGKAFEGFIRARPLQDFLCSSLNGDAVMERELVLHGGDHFITLHAHAIPLYDGDGKRMGILVVMNNLTKLNKLENIRQDFVANVSHELKTPITSIRGYVETLLDGALDDRKAAGKFLNIIDRQGRRLEAIVEDLLTLARIEDKEGKKSVLLETEKIKPVLEAAMQTCFVQARQKNMIIKVECVPALTGRINRPMLEQAIINLLTNSITYCPAGTPILLSAYKHDVLDDRGSVCISVTDKGPGIADKHRERVFERFYRCDKARSRKHGGTGLGLAIVKHIAVAHKGRVKLESTYGQGAVFSIIIPA
jgi:two-component system phosphate regulon sensor histidine kinase PhoR